MSSEVSQESVGATVEGVSTSSIVPPRVRRTVDAVVASHWTVEVIAVLSLLILLCGACGALVQTRLYEIAYASSQNADGTFDPAPALPPAYDFTLAPEDLRPLAEDEARVANEEIPFSTLPIIAARPFVMDPTNLIDYSRALDCLTAAIYYEAANEPGEGQQAVAQVIINRMRHPAFPKTICGVIFQGSERPGCQFSFACYGSMSRTPSIAGWARARAVAASALNGTVARSVGLATHYHADYVAPYWAPRLVKLTKIGAHIFYRWTGAWGLPGSFNGRHASAEPLIAKMALLITPVEEIDLTAPIEPVDTTLDLDSSPPLPPVQTVEAEPVEEAPTPEPEPVVAVEPPAPPPVHVVVNPLANPSAPTVPGVQPARRRRIAVPN